MYLLLDNIIDLNILNCIFHLKKSPSHFHYTSTYHSTGSTTIYRFDVQSLSNATIVNGLVFAVAKQLQFKIQISTYISQAEINCLEIRSDIICKNVKCNLIQKV